MRIIIDTGADASDQPVGMERSSPSGGSQAQDEREHGVPLDGGAGPAEGSSPEADGGSPSPELIEAVERTRRGENLDRPEGADGDGANGDAGPGPE